MLTMSVRTGEAVQLGDVAVIKIENKGGQHVRLRFYTSVAPILRIPSGLVPPGFVTGLTRPTAPRVLEAVS